jgi:glycosyltransferase involved in cell wall biosynthesis
MPNTLHIVAPSYVAATVGGSGTAFVEITRRLLEIEPRVQVYLNGEAAAHLREFKDATVVVPTASMRSGWRKAMAMLQLELTAKWQIPTDEPVWFPLGMVIPQTFRGRAVSTLYDTLQRDLPSCLPFLERAFRKVKVPLAVKRTVVVTSSQFSASQLRKHYGATVDVIPLAPIALPEAGEANVPNGEYVIYPANAWPHKNHRFLLQLWRRNPALQRLALVFTLGSGLGALAQEIAEARVAGVNVVVTGWQSPSQLAAFYERSYCTVFPSLYEGFGLPVQEALLCGCPVIMSDRGSLPETVSPGYPYCLPLNEEDWLRALVSQPRAHITNPAEYLPRWTWMDCAKLYQSKFRQLCD